MKTDHIVNKVVEMIDEAKTMGDLDQILHTIAYTIGGLVMHFEEEDRTAVVIGLTESLGKGLMSTAKSMGQPSSLVIETGRMQG